MTSQHQDTDIVADVEKHPETPVIYKDGSAAAISISSLPDGNASPKFARIRRWNTRIESLSGWEARGIARVLPGERQSPSAAAYFQMILLWFSANITINNLVIGLYGPLVFELGFLDSILCAVFGAALGAATTAYMSTWGPASGCRTLVVARYAMGYWPSKICVALNVVLMVGYCTVTSIIGGQILSAVSGGTMTIAVGIVVVNIVVLVVAAVGLKVFHIYERYAWLPQILILFIFIGVAGPHFTTSLESSGSESQTTANRLSFFTLCFYAPNSWAGAASDYWVYYPENTPAWKTFVLTYTGLTLSFSFVNMLGVGLASGVAINPPWTTAYSTSVGALITSAFSPLAGFGNVCAVITCLGLIANSTPGTYSAALNCQMVGRYGAFIPRWVWTIAIVIVELVCALAGRDKVFIVFQNVLALMGYWLMIMICIIAEEHILFRRMSGLKFDWDAWNDKTRLPLGIAAFISFVVGWVGAVLGMYQVWYVGPLAKLVGDTGADIGMWFGCALTLVVFPPMRILELRLIGR